MEQKISKSKVDEIIKYVSQVKEIGDQVETKEFYEGVYRIRVESAEEVGIVVCLR